LAFSPVGSVGSHQRPTGTRSPLKGELSRQSRDWGVPKKGRKAQVCAGFQRAGTSPPPDGGPRRLQSNLLPLFRGGKGYCYLSVSQIPI